MIEELKRIENSLSPVFNGKIMNLTAEDECEEYAGYNFQINGRNIKFRKAKITPKKVGQFVTLWRRNSENITEPFNESDKFDYYIIATEEKGRFGFFIFSKGILIEKGILTTDKKDGKRGFRLYPEWTTTENKQAEKTQSWQVKYFIDVTSADANCSEKIKFYFR